MKAKKALILIVIVVLLAVGLSLFILFNKNIIMVGNGGHAMDLSPIPETTFTNFMHLDQEWEDYGVGDPYIMRFNGTYYLYCSTKDHRVGIKCWSSIDLVNWKYEGLCAEEDLTASAYAPEVIYNNGYFYMATSPAGKGHYILKSGNPKGPFKSVTENLGCSIDGSIFTDDDGKLYFYNAGSKGIQAQEMENPTSLRKGSEIGAYLNGWTEGAMVIKRYGKYYLTYTGNNVWSRGYRVNYAVSSEGAVQGYRIPANNPIIISVKDEFFGLGHSSTVLGPDMDSWYIAYHNLIGASNEGPPVRQLNIDRLVFNGGSMSVAGPTNYPQRTPRMPDFYTWVNMDGTETYWNRKVQADGGVILVSNKTHGPVFNAEFNVGNISGEGSFRAIAGYTDKEYYAVDIAPKGNKLSAIVCSDNNEKEIVSANLPVMPDYTKLHSLRIENSVSRLYVYFDGMCIITADKLPTSGGSIGYRSKGDVSVEYVAFSNDAGGSSDFDAYKAVPGSIEAVHYMKNEGRGCKSKGESQENDYRTGDGMNLIKAEDDSYALRLSAGEWVKYAVNVEKEGFYSIDAIVANTAEDKIFLVKADDSKEQQLTMKTNSDLKDQWVKNRIGVVKLPAGFHTLTVKLKSSRAEILKFEIYPVANEEINTQNLGIVSHVKEWERYGIWKFTEDSLSSFKTENGAVLAGDTSWADYSMECDVILGKNVEAGKAGILVRSTNASEFKDQVLQSVMGYFISLGNNGISLSKLNYDLTPIDSWKGDIPSDQPVHIKVECKGNKITIYLNDIEKPVLTYSDPNAFMYGKAGFLSFKSTLTAKNISIKTMN